MNSLFFCLALAAAPVFGGQWGVPLAPIALYTQFQQDVPVEVLKSLQAELQHIMAPIGLNFQWRDLAATNGNLSSVELAVINFRGRCDVSGLLPHSFSPGPLGWTHISDGVILPFADVDCGAVRTFVQKELLLTRPVDRALLLGRALGRVLAHELYHIFANTTHHGSEGIGREFYSVQELLSSDFQFEVRESKALKNSKAFAALANSVIADSTIEY